MVGFVYQCTNFTFSSQILQHISLHRILIHTNAQHVNKTCSSVIPIKEGIFCILQSNAGLVFVGLGLKYNCRHMSNWLVCKIGRSWCETTVMLSKADSETARGSVLHQWGLTHANLGLYTLRQSTWCAECPGGFEQLWPRPGGHVHCSGLMCGCPQHWNISKDTEGLIMSVCSVWFSKAFFTYLVYQNKSEKWLCVLTCHVLCPPSDNEHEKLPNGRSRLVLGWKLSGCSAHKCGIAGRWGPGVHLMRSGCHPRAHGSEMACWFPAPSENRWNMSLRVLKIFR